MNGEIFVMLDWVGCDECFGLEFICQNRSSTVSCDRDSTLATEGRTHGCPVSSRYTPAPKLTFAGWGSFWNAAVSAKASSRGSSRRSSFAMFSRCMLDTSG